jgi:hypothetical protein
MEFKTMSLRECAFADCPIDKREELAAKYRKRANTARMNRRVNTAKRDERSMAANVAPSRSK